MAKFKIIVSDPETGKSQFVEVEETQAIPLIGRKLGEEIDGSMIRMSGHKLRITGGSDRDGFHMRPNVHGGVRTSIALSAGVGFHPSRKGERQRKNLRGNIITEDIVQLNMRIIEKPKKEKPSKGKAKTEVEEKPADN